MCDGVRDLLEIHSCAFNGRALETLEPWWSEETACFCDGTIVGEGRKTVMSALSREFGNGLIARVMDHGGGPAIVAFDGPEGEGDPRVVVRLEGHDRITTCRIEHVRGPA